MVSGPENAISEQSSGQFKLQTVMLETDDKNKEMKDWNIVGGKFEPFPIDFGAFDSDIKTEKGGITP